MIDVLNEHYENSTPIVDVMHEELLSLYRLYLCIGGMPASINNILSVDKDIINYNKIVKRSNILFCCCSIWPCGDRRGLLRLCLLQPQWEGHN